MNNQELALQLDYIERCKSEVTKLADRIGHTPTCAVITFGCQMNARDSEKLRGIAKEVGLLESDDELSADMVIYNTCTVRDNANQKIYGHLGTLKAEKRKNPNKYIGLCGCMMQEDKVIQLIREKYSFVNLVFGTHNIFKFAELLYRMLTSDSQIIDIWQETETIVEELPVERKYFFKSGINIMFGCNNFCSYCIVPYVRGRERSRTPDDIISEIERLVDDGVVEVMLLGQNVNSYGKNLPEPITFAQLLKRIESIEGLRRIRFMTSHPKDLSDELIEVMSKSTKICRQLHLPIQSGSNRILKAMNRGYSREKYLELITKIRNAMPDIAITTDIIVGFPGETEDDVNDTIDIVRRVGFDNAFTFIYSMRTGTPAAAMEQLDSKFVKRQFDRVLSAVQEEACRQRGNLVGETLDVLVEEINEQRSDYVTGKLGSGVTVHMPGEASLIGKIVKVRLTDSKGFYYYGELVD